MAKAKYDIGDILTLCEDGKCYATAVIVSSYMSDYNLFIKPNGNDDFRFIRDVPEMVLCKYKVVGHIDISGMPNDKVKTHLDCAIATVWKTAWSEYVIAYAVQTYWELMKLRESKEENKELSEHNEKLYQELSKLKEKADSRLDEITFLVRKVDEVENERDKLKTEYDEANHEIDRLRTVVGGLNGVIDNLNDSKSEISDLFCSLKDTLQTDDILEGVNKLKEENKRLIEENGKLTQKISCADKLLAEAANRLYQGRAHFNISAHN